MSLTDTQTNPQNNIFENLTFEMWKSTCENTFGLEGPEQQE